MKPKEIAPPAPPAPAVEALCRRARYLRLTALWLDEDGHVDGASAARRDLTNVMRRLAGMDVPSDLRRRYLN